MLASKLKINCFYRVQFYVCVLCLKRCVGLLRSLFVRTRNIYTLFVYTTAFILGTDKYHYFYRSL